MCVCIGCLSFTLLMVSLQCASVCVFQCALCHLILHSSHQLHVHTPWLPFYDTVFLITVYLNTYWVFLLWIVGCYGALVCCSRAGWVCACWVGSVSPFLHFDLSFAVSPISSSRAVPTNTPWYMHKCSVWWCSRLERLFLVTRSLTWPYLGTFGHC